MSGTLVNALAVVLGGGIGLLLNSKFPERISKSLMKALGLCTMYIGITGVQKGENTLLAVISVALGTVIGEILRLDDRLNNTAQMLQSKISKDNSKSTLAEGFVNASLLFCVGAMAVVGSLESGLTGSNQMIYTKSILDFTSAIIFASTLGAGVLLSAIPIILYQGTIVLLASRLTPYLTDYVVSEMTCVGSILIIGISLNLLGITKLKVMNYVPAIFIPIVLCMFM